MCKGTRVRHGSAGSLGVTLRDSFFSRSPYNPGEWTEVRCDDGFVYWAPVSALVPA